MTDWSAFMLTIRDPEAADWMAIASLADEAVLHVDGAPVQNIWVKNRLNFDGVRQHYVAEEEGRVVGYGSVERAATETNDGFRLFLVLRWLTPDSARIAAGLLERLRQDVGVLEIGHVWLREYAKDRPFIDFLTSHGFEVTKEYEHGGDAMINLEATDRFLAVSRNNLPRRPLVTTSRHFFRKRRSCQRARCRSSAWRV